MCTDGLVILRSRCLSAGAEDFIVKPLQSKDVQRLRNCSTVGRPSNKGGATLPCEENAVAKWSNNKLPPSAGAGAGASATSPSGRRANLAGVAMVRTHHVALPFPRTVRLKLNVSLTVSRVFLCQRQVLHSSRVEISQYLPLLLKLVVLAYAALCLGELLHRWSSGGSCSLSPWCA